MISKEQLLKARLAEETVDIPGAGQVRLRQLSWSEGMELKDFAADPAELYKQVLARAMVEPTLTCDEVGAWMAAVPAGEVEAVAVKALQLSGLAESAEFRDDTGASARGT